MALAECSLWQATQLSGPILRTKRSSLIVDHCTSSSEWHSSPRKNSSCYNIVSLRVIVWDHDHDLRVCWEMRLFIAEFPPGLHGGEWVNQISVVGGAQGVAEVHSLHNLKSEDLAPMIQIHNHISSLFWHFDTLREDTNVIFISVP